MDGCTCAHRAPPCGEPRRAAGLFGEVRVVILAHRAQRAFLMMAQLLLGIAVLRADHTIQPRIASRGAIRRGLNPMPDAFDHVPSAIADGSDRTGRHATPRHASRTWVEAQTLGRFL